ncbi:hypothetical protein IHE55_06715 [Streptomyces pactum]|uniref:DUF2867 domain-containing protein n=1 Tax=Streptomyces pactum TaxID=68249 RepID=A0ABS0NH39_9ACTN|nr:hypothetical protein [Streptomyces pactum]MBH5334509.1 hypothetical protein [Streptomyces pactum]
MELDRLLPAYEFRSHHHRRIAADRDTTWEAYRTLTPEDMPTSWQLMRMRGFGRSGPPGPADDTFPVPLLSTVPYEEVRGRAGRYWQPRPTYAPLPPGDADAFRALSEPGWAKAAVGIRVVPDGDGSVLTVETRVHCTDLRSRLAFAPYWLAIRAGGAGLIRLELLRAVARHAEARTGA